MDLDRVDQALLLVWMEHCVECAVPECYSVCTLYEPRRDRKCARLRYGIFPNPSFSGLYPYGADVWFRRWGKLEAKLTAGFATVARHRASAARDARFLHGIHAIADRLEPIDPHRRLNGAYSLLRQRLLDRSVGPGRADEVRVDEFVAEVYNPQDAPVDLVLEIHQDRLRCRKSLRLAPGPNLPRIPFAALDVDLTRPVGRILVQPANDAEVRLIFTWLDLVRYAATPQAGTGAPAPPTASDSVCRKPASKIKVVAWDLDHTLWDGILVEDGAAALVPSPAALALIPALDQRGILQTIVSKNDHAQAWDVIVRLGLDGYFLSPAINWGRKSENLRQIAQQLDLGLDTFALIDDSAFERGEVEHELPEVRTYDATEIPSLFSRPEFDVPISDESRNRRLSYAAEGQRREIAQSFGDNYDEFLRSCEMRLELFRPEEPRTQERCLELLQRSNQLNLSTRRYTREELVALIAEPAMATLALGCRDRYGDYGTVGFVAIDLSQPTAPALRDLVLSCRVARKKVEPALFEWLRRELRARGATRLAAHFLPTARNGVLLEALRESGFVVRDQRADQVTLELDLTSPVPSGTVLTVEAVTPLATAAAAGPGSTHAS